MPDTPRGGLRDRLVQRYGELRKRLEFMTGSKDTADDVLHDTWVRLETAQAAPASNPDGYLLRMASNIATDEYRRHRKTTLLDEQEIEALMHIADDAADPERIVAGRSEVARLDDVLDELPPRRRDILVAARLEGLMNRQIAERWGISVSAVEKELRLAMAHCKQRMGDVQAAQGDNPVGRRRRNAE